MPPLSSQRMVPSVMLLLVGLSTAAVAEADDTRGEDALAPPAPPTDRTVDEGAVDKTIDRTWLYADDARTPAPMTVIAMTSASYTSVGSASQRVGSPFPYSYSSFAGSTAAPGALLSVGAEVGLLSWLSASATFQGETGGEHGTSAGALASLRARVTPSSWENLRVVASVGYAREAFEGPYYVDDAKRWYPGSPGGANGAWVQGAVVGEIGDLQLAGTLHLQHVFSVGRDLADITVMAGATYRVFGPLRLGAEYVGQDLEESFSSGAEGGARHFLGPTASAKLLGDRLAVVLGPSFGLSATSPNVTGRLSVVGSF